MLECDLLREPAAREKPRMSNSSYPSRSSNLVPGRTPRLITQPHEIAVVTDFLLSCLI